MRAYMACFLCILALTAPESALAWTDGRVTSVSAQLDVRDPEIARVEIALRLVVRSGSLSSFDLEGLDPDFELLDLEAPSGAGQPQVLRNLPGQLQLQWSDPRDAPRPGEHALRVVYATKHLYTEANDARSRRVVWTMPRWPERLSNVRITVLGPPGISPSITEPNFGEQVEVQPPGNAARMLTYTRVELPRTTGYRVQFDLPPLAAAGTSHVSDVFQHIRAIELPRSLARDAWLLVIGVILGVLVVGKRRVRRKLLVAPRMLVAWLEPRTFDGLIFGFAALAPVLIERAPTLALATALIAVASALERKRRPPAALVTPAADSGERASSAHWLNAHAALDATTPTGLLSLGVVLAAALWAPEPLRTTALICGWLATPLFFSGTRRVL
jgi:hypothetical protein